MLFLLSFLAALHYRDCVLVSKTEVNHNTSVFRLQLGCGSVMHVPVGKHVYLKTQVQGMWVATVLLIRHLIHRSSTVLLLKLKPFPKQNK